MSYFCRCVSASLFAALALSALIPAAAADQRSPRPTSSAPRQVPPVLAQGETLTYMVTLNELPAGESRIRLSRAQHAGREVYRATAQGQTSELIAYLYRLHGMADGLFATNGFTPLAFRLTYSDHKRAREIGVRYDPTSRTLVGTARKKAQAKERSVPAGDVYDPLTAFYVLRSSDLVPANIVQADVFTGKERYRVIAHVVGRENVLLTGGIRPAIRLQPAIFSLDEAPEENLLPQETSLWVSTDPAHVPLKLESFLPLGRVVIELTGSTVGSERKVNED